MTVADTNVRPAWRSPAVSARGARRLGLARLLLPLLELLQLDRTLLLLFAASLMPACIIPVGPEWQDPPGAANAGPTIISKMPEVGTRSTSAAFRVVLSDPEGDQIFVKWFADFPPFIPGSSYVGLEMELRQAGPGMPVAAETTFQCTFHIMSSQPTHQIMLAIHDRHFKDGDGIDPRATVDGRTPIELVWFLDKVCPASP